MNTPQLTDLQKEVANHLYSHSSKHSPISNKKLTETLGLRRITTGEEGADMRAVVNALRKKGVPIIAGTKGYWYASTEQELNDFTDSLRGRISKQQEALDGLVHSAKDLVKENFKPGVEMAQEDRQATLSV